jgi:endonuclease YncB( thermonuclease family)
MLLLYDPPFSSYLLSYSCYQLQHCSKWYGRFVAQCFLPDGRDITGEMLRAGVAREYCSYSRGFYGAC